MLYNVKGDPSCSMNDLLYPRMNREGQAKVDVVKSIYCVIISVEFGNTVFLGSLMPAFLYKPELII